MKWLRRPCRCTWQTCNGPARAKPSANGSPRNSRARKFPSPATKNRPPLPAPAKARRNKKGVVTPIIKLSSPATRDFWEIPVLFEDDTLLAIDKPARLLVSPDRYDIMRPNIMRLLHSDIARGAKWVQERGVTYLANAHRLDFE